MSKTIAVRRGNFAFLYVPGMTFLSVHRADDVLDTHVRAGTVPFDMMTVPEWINRSRVDVNGVLAMALLWLEYQGAVARPLVHGEMDAP